MTIYINGIGLISPQETRDNQKFLEEVKQNEDDFFQIIEPPYKEYIPPRELRRMSKVLRNGLVAAKIALSESGLENPDAIITGTGLGCAKDTEKFLIAMSENKETMLTPTSFIQSTHNTLGGSIAIGLGCHQYNMTYVNRGFSFESALLDAQLMMDNNEIQNVLVGGFDEMTEQYDKLLKTTRFYDPILGAVAGQSSGFFALETEHKKNSYAVLKELITLYKPNKTELKDKIKSIIKEHEIDLSKTIVLMGYNGSKLASVNYDFLREHIFTHSCIGQFKNLCGEFYTATVFAFWSAAQILKKQTLPQSLYLAGEIPQDIDKVLIYNQYQDDEHSLILLAKC